MSGGSKTKTQTTTVNADLGVNVEGISIGGGVSTSSSAATTESSSVQFSIPPGKQAVYVAGVEHTSQTGNVQVNYGDRQFGHFIVSVPTPPPLTLLCNVLMMGFTRSGLRAQPSRS